MSAGRTAPDAEVVGVETVFRGVGPQEADGSFAVVDLGGERRVLAEPIVDVGDCIPSPQELHGRSWSAILAPALPGSTMYPNEHWMRSLVFCRKEEIQRVALLVSPIGQVALTLTPWVNGGCRAFGSWATTKDAINTGRQRLIITVNHRVMGSSLSFLGAGSTGPVVCLNALRTGGAASVSVGISQMNVDLVTRDLARPS